MSVFIAINNLNNPFKTYYNLAFLMYIYDFAIFYALIK